MKEGFPRLSGKGEVLPFGFCFLPWVGISGHCRRHSAPCIAAASGPWSNRSCALRCPCGCHHPLLPCAGQLEAVRS